MPEGDTVWLAARRLDERLGGQTVTASDFRVPQLAVADVTGRAVTGVVAHGKHLFTRFDDGTSLHSHFRMDGSWHLYRPGERWRGGPAYDVRAILTTEPWQAVGYRLHELALVPTGQESRYDGHLGPDVLREDWDPGEAVRRVRAAPARTVGEALLDQRNLAGVGNLYLCETAFWEHVTPWTAVRDVDVDALVARAARLLQRNKGVSDQNTTGLPGRERTHFVHGRAKRPCLRCGTPVRIGYLGDDEQARVVYFCPVCQHGPGPTRVPPPGPPPRRASRYR